MDNQSLSQQPYLTFFDADTAEYDVIVDQSSSAPNLKEAAWGALQPLLPLIADKIGPQEFSLLLEYSPLPESFLEKFEAIQDERAQQPPPPDPEMQKLQADQAMKQQELQFQQQKAQTDSQIKAQDMQMSAQLEQQKMAAQIQLERERLQAQIKLKRIEVRQKAVAERVEGDDGEAPDIEIEGADDMDEQDMDLFGNKALSDAMTEMARSISAMAQGVAALGLKIEESMSRPKTIVRGPDGRAIGVR